MSADQKQDQKQKHEHAWKADGSWWRCACGAPHPPIERVAFTYYETPDQKWRVVELTFDGKTTKEKVLDDTHAPSLAARLARQHEIERFRKVSR